MADLYLRFAPDWKLMVMKYKRVFKRLQSLTESKTRRNAISSCL